MKPAGLHPAYFALVMATGIVSIAAHVTGMRGIALAMFALNSVFYLWLWSMTATRLLRHRDRIAADLLDHGRVLLFCLCLWLGGGMLYVWIISLIFYRYTFFQLLPSELAPPYWINMGLECTRSAPSVCLRRSASNCWPTSRGPSPM